MAEPNISIENTNKFVLDTAGDVGIKVTNNKLAVRDVGFGEILAECCWMAEC